MVASGNGWQTYRMDFTSRFVALGAYFTEGVGDDDPGRPNGVRGWADRVAEQLGWFGVKLDPTENSRNARLISRQNSLIPVYVVPTDEELMIAQHTLALLMNGQSPSHTKARVS